MQSYLTQLADQYPSISGDTEAVKHSMGWLLYYLMEDLKSLKGGTNHESVVSLGSGQFASLAACEGNRALYEAAAGETYAEVMLETTAFNDDAEAEEISIATSLAVPLTGGGQGECFVKTQATDGSVQPWDQCE